MSNNIISSELLKQAPKGGKVSGVILVKDYSVALTKANKEYIVGNLMSGEAIGFKAWLGSVAFTKLKNEDYTNVPCLITGTFDDYNGTSTVIVETVVAVEGFDPSDFLPVKYDAESYFKALVNLSKNVLSEKGFNLVSEALFDVEDIKQRFMYEFAGKSHHDSCKSGLLAHTYKVTNNMVNIINQYKSLCSGSTDIRDLYIIGAILHDIGKIWELNYGSYQPKAIVTHRYLGLEYISNNFRGKIIELYDEEWYYNLASIFLQHHGEFDDDCRTIYAQVVHMADILDTDLTSLVEALSTATNERIRFRDKYLNFIVKE